MNKFAALLDALTYDASRNGKLALMQNYFATTPDPSRGWALAALTSQLDIKGAKAGLLRELISERTDPILFALSYDYVGDLSETIALMWPGQHGANRAADLTDVIDGLKVTPRKDIPELLVHWLDGLDETGRWALLKLITKGLRVGVSARLAKTALARFGDVKVSEIEELWHGLEPPYETLFAWLEGQGEKPKNDNPAPFSPVMLAHPIEDNDFETLDPQEFCAEWKWDGIRVQAVTSVDQTGQRVARLYSRTGDDISSAFPDLVEALPDNMTLDGELLVVKEGVVAPFSSLQKRLNRKTVSAKLMREFPAHIRVYDLLRCGDKDLRDRSFSKRRGELERRFSDVTDERLSISELLDFESWKELGKLRAAVSTKSDAVLDADVIEGCMIKRKESAYKSGRPRGEWFKWKREPFILDAVLMYAQRGHGKRSGLYSDYTFGVWDKSDAGMNLTPVGKAYFGFTDEELKQIDRFVRNNMTERFGPVRGVRAEPDHGLVLEIAFEGLNESTRHKSGVAMRFPRISRLRWDKAPKDADDLSTVKKLLPSR